MTTNSTRSERRDRLVAAGALDGVTSAPVEAATVASVEYRPEVPVKVRDFAYFTGLVVAALVLLVVGVTGIWFPDIADPVAKTGVVVGQAVALITAGIGVVYRPGAQH